MMMLQSSIVLFLTLLRVSVVTAFGPTASVPLRLSALLLHSAKTDFLQSLSRFDTLNEGTTERTELLNELIAVKQETNVETVLLKANDNDIAWSVQNPASLSSMLPSIAPGTWKVIYAPHMSTIAKLAGGLSLDVTYILYANQTIVSHATFSNPALPQPLFHLSVSGTFDSVSDTVCCVEWTDAWIKSSNDDNDEPYATIRDVPDSFLKTIITNVGQLLFIRPFSIFPVSFLSNDMTVFDFELLGTRICAKKQ